MNRRLFMRLSLSLVCLGLFASSLPAAEHTTDSLDTVKEKIKAKEAILVDVREKSEWEEGHVKDARFSPLSELKEDDSLEKLLKTLPKDKILYCHCRAGRRALTAADILKKKGYDVRPLKPGFEELIKAGFEKADK